MVLASYKQICAQDAAVLSDVDEDNFDRAFDMIRPGKSGLTFAVRHIYSQLCSHPRHRRRQQEADRR